MTMGLVVLGYLIHGIFVHSYRTIVLGMCGTLMSSVSVPDWTDIRGIQFRYYIYVIYTLIFLYALLGHMSGYAKCTKDAL